jgi:hypothetical protein
MTTAINNFSSQAAARPSTTNLFLAIASKLLCLNLRETLAVQASAEQNNDASYSWGM